MSIPAIFSVEKINIITAVAGEKYTKKGDLK